MSTCPNTAVRPAVYERDVDAVLAEALAREPRFQAFFVEAVENHVGCRLSFDGISVDRQVHHFGTRGSIDLAARLWTMDRRERALLLIEDKLDSSFTPDQPERYASSAAAASRAGHPAYAVLCAPAEYIRRSRHVSPFHAAISYEDIAMALQGEARAVIEHAIRRFEMPYEPDPVPAVAEFFRGYEEVARRHAPDLVIKSNPNSSDARPAASRTIYFVTKRTLPQYDFLPTLRFSHQCWDSGASSPSVKIMFDGWAVFGSLLRQVAKDDLALTGFYLRKAGRSLGLTRDTPRMDNTKPVGNQMEAVLQGLRAASALRAWMCSNEDVLRRWSTTVAEASAQ